MTKAKVWEHYIRNDNFATCKTCKKVIKCKGGTTSGLVSHLKTQHGQLLHQEKIAEAQEDKLAPKQSLIKFTSPQSFEEQISELVAADGFSFNQVATSNFIRQNLFRSFGKSLKSPSAVKNLVIQFAASQKIILRKELTSNCDSRYSLSFDEWTSCRKRRYLGIKLHSATLSYGLGLVRIVCSCPANKLKSLNDSTLAEFGLSLNRDIVAVICDGASVNVKLGTDIEPFVQLCINHGLHLTSKPFEW